MVDILNKECLKDRMTFLEKILSEIRKRSANPVKGSLRISRCNGKVQFYYRANSGQKWTYVRKEQRGTAIKLAQRDYLKAVRRSAERELNALQAIMEMSDSWEKLYKPEEVYQILKEGKRELVRPVLLTDQQYTLQWMKREYQHKGIGDDIPEFMTDRGERVRSKSELMIANTLNRLGIPYRYEYPLKIGRVTIHPDFMILKPGTRKEYLWEHLGRMDDTSYASDTVYRILQYERAGYYIGENLILTWESSTQPLETKQILLMADRYFPR